MRSPTAADLFSGRNGIETDFAGLSNDADERLSLDQIQWADVIYVMENRQKARLNALFGTHLKSVRVVSLGIPDKFEYMQPELVELLEDKLRGVS